MKNQIEIVYEDDDLVVVNKPANLLTIPDRFAADKPNLYHMLGNEFGKIFTVHRLDRETSGILVFTKTEEAHKELSKQFMDRTVEKIYFALVDGSSLQPITQTHPCGRLITTARLGSVRLLDNIAAG